MNLNWSLHSVVNHYYFFNIIWFWLDSLLSLRLLNKDLLDNIFVLWLEFDQIVDISEHFLFDLLDNHLLGDVVDLRHIFSFIENDSLFNKLRHLLDDLHSSLQFNWLLSDHFNSLLLGDVDWHLSLNNLDIPHCHHFLDDSVDVGWHFLLYDDFVWDSFLDFNTLHYLSFDICHHSFLNFCHLGLFLDDDLRHFFSQDFLDFVGDVDGHWSLDLDNLDNLDLSLDNLLDYLGNLHNSLDDSWDHHDLLDYLLDFNHARNLHNLLDESVHGNSHLLDHLLFLDDRHWDLFDDLHWHLLTIWHESLHFYGHDFRFRLDIWHLKFHVNWFFNSNVKWHWFFDLHVLCHESFLINWLVSELINLDYHFFGVSLDHLNCFSRHFQHNFLG